MSNDLRRVLVAGSRSFPLDPIVGEQVVDLMREAGEVVFLTRTAKEGFDRFVAGVATLLGRPCVMYKGSGADNFERDNEIAEACDRAMLFFDPSQLDMAVESGTQHLADCLLNKRRPIRAWSVIDHKLVFAGEHP